jgi:hypothetical protein
MVFLSLISVTGSVTMISKKKNGNPSLLKAELQAGSGCSLSLCRWVLAPFEAA